MRTPWTSWVERCAATEPGTTLALVRIALGAILLVDAIGMLGADVAWPLLAPIDEGGLAPSRAQVPIVGWLGGPSRPLAGALVWGSLLGSAALLVGLGGRVTAFTLLQIRLALQGLSPDIEGGFDRLFANGLWLLVLGDATATLALDARLATGRWWSLRPVSALPRYLFVYQTVVLYTATGLAKVGEGWQAPYAALYHALLRTPYVRSEHGWVADVYPWLQVATVTAWWWETLFVVLGLWFLARSAWFGERARGWARRWDLRVPFLGLGLVTHLVLWALLDLGPFTAVTFAFYLSFFSHEEWAALIPTRRSRTATG